jgi:ubiquinone/menaquinone biosynthesis C-methylase UbiE
MVCPWWLGFAIDNPLRRLFHDPARILGPYIRSGSTVLDIGAGTGFFSIPLAGMVGPAGHVTAIDIQPGMLGVLSRKARARGLADIIRPHLAAPDSLGNHSGADFILAFWVVHEVPDQRAFLAEVFSFLEPDGFFLLVEPLVHVSEKSFLRTIQIAADIGFAAKGTPKIPLSRGVLLVKKGQEDMERGGSYG